jgi:hypothetical protein
MNVASPSDISFSTLSRALDQFWLEQPVSLRGSRWQGRYFWEIHPILAYITGWASWDIRWARAYTALHTAGIVSLVADSTGDFLALLGSQTKAAAEIVGTCVERCPDSWADRATALSYAIHSGSFQIIASVPEEEAAYVMRNPIDLPLMPGIDE